MSEPYYTCPYCNRTYKGRIPKDGDGSALCYPRHHRKVFNLNGSENVVIPVFTVELCPGSLQEVQMLMWDGEQ